MEPSFKMAALRTLWIGFLLLSSAPLQLCHCESMNLLWTSRVFKVKNRHGLSFLPNTNARLCSELRSSRAAGLANVAIASPLHCFWGGDQNPHLCVSSALQWFGGCTGRPYCFNLSFLVSGIRLPMSSYCHLCAVCSVCLAL